VAQLHLMAERGSLAEERAKGAERGDKGEKSDKGDKPEKLEKAEKPDRARREGEPELAASKPPPPVLESEPPADPAPSIPPLPAAGPWRSYKEQVAQIASRIVEAQRPIRVLQAIRWDNEVEETFLRNRGRELPNVGPEWYASVDLGFEPRAKAAEFEDIARDIDRELGEDDAIGDIMAKTALEYRDTVRMLAARGTKPFYGYSRKLYGSPKDKFPDGKSTVRDLGHMLYSLLTNVDHESLMESGTGAFERTLSSQ